MPQGKTEAFIRRLGNHVGVTTEDQCRRPDAATQSDPVPEVQFSREQADTPACEQALLFGRAAKPRGAEKKRAYNDLDVVRCPVNKKTY